MGRAPIRSSDYKLDIFRDFAQIFSNCLKAFRSLSIDEPDRLVTQSLNGSATDLAWGKCLLTDSLQMHLPNQISALGYRPHRIDKSSS